jgi:hypothetical protein
LRFSSNEKQRAFLSRENTTAPRAGITLKIRSRASKFQG